MNEYNNIWKNRAINHDIGAHTRRQQHFIKDPSCVICNSIDSIIISEEFTRYWNWYQTIVPAETYSSQTIESFNELLQEENLVETTVPRIRREIERIIGSVRYTRAPGISLQEIKREIVERFVFSKYFTLGE